MVFRSWEDKYGFVYLKKSDADKEFTYFRNEMELLETKIKRLEKDQDQMRNNFVLHTEFISKITECVQRDQFTMLSDYVTSLPKKDELDEKFQQINEAARKITEMVHSKFVSKAELDQSNKNLTRDILNETITQTDYKKIA